MCEVLKGWLGVGGAIQELYWHSLDMYLGESKTTFGEDLQTSSKAPCCFHNQGGSWEWDGYGPCARYINPLSTKNLTPKTLRRYTLLIIGDKEWLI